MGRIRRLSLRHQQLLFFGVVTVFVLAVLGLAISASARYAQTFGDSLNRYLQLHDLRVGVATVHAQLELYVRDSSPERMVEIRRLENDIEETWESLRTLEITDRSSQLEMRAVYYGLLAYRSSAERVLRQYAADDGRFAFSLSYASRIQRYVDEYLDRLFSVQLDRGRTEYERALQRQEDLRGWTAGAIILVGLALGVFATLFSRSVTTPLERLVRDAHALAGGDFDRPALEIPESSDLREVALAFNTMSASIRTLVGDLRDKQSLERKLHQQELSNMQMERLLRESQLVALQSQVNPHFLFNTLNSIARTARLESASQSEDLIRGLSGVLRYILRNPRQSVPLREEIRVVGDYLALQQVRFASRLTYTVSVEPETEDVAIPPLLLQPLVENSVIHGIEPLEAGGSITIVAERIPNDPDKRIRILITDNGAGMNAETVEQLMATAPTTFGESTDRIGVLNVRARLALFYGAESAFTISSTRAGGTTIEIIVPRELPEQHHAVHRSDS